MCGVLNRYRISRGWQALTPEDGETTANVWIEQLDKHGVPAGVYERLYWKCTDARAAAIRKGEDPPDFSAELMASMWDGPTGLRSEIAAKVARGRMLECPKCQGTGWKEFMPKDGRYPGVVRCGHD